MATVWLCKPAEDELKRFTRKQQQAVSDAITLLEDDTYRQQNMLDLNLIERNFKIFSLIVGGVWLGFHEDNTGDVWVDWVSLRSRFRP